MTYLFKFKRRFFWKSVAVVGHRFEKDQDKVVLYFQDGGLEEIPEWSKCAVKLGTDWVLAAKKNLESQVGQTIPVNR